MTRLADRLWRGAGIALRLILAGQWRQLVWLARLRMLKLDIGFVSVEETGLSPQDSHYHSSSGGPDLEYVLKQMEVQSTDSVLDFGCGKGGALITLARFPFARVDGVEIAPALVQIAQANLSRLHIRNAEVFCCDATEFTNLDRYTHIYFYNPFSCQVMRRVMKNLCDSLARQPRALTILYKNPVCHETIIAEAKFKKIREYDHSDTKFILYKCDTAQESSLLPDYY